MSPPRCRYRMLCRRSHRWNHFRFWCGLCSISISAVSNETAQLPCYVFSFALFLSCSCSRQHHLIPFATVRNVTTIPTEFQNAREMRHARKQGKKIYVPSNSTNRSCVRHFIFWLEFIYFFSIALFVPKKIASVCRFFHLYCQLLWRKISWDRMNKYTGSLRKQAI